jgi:alanine-synthesizing transaminase
MSEEFYRMRRLPPYVIAEVNSMRHAARTAGEDVIDLGMGNPDLPPPAHVIDKLIEVARNPDAHGYSQSRGIPGLRRAQAAYYARRFGVDLDPETEVIVTMGSKEGLASLATAITEPGDVVLAPNPSYPIHTFGFIIAGAAIRSVPTTPDEKYFEALERAMAYTVPRPKVLVMNYPSNPTAETVDLAFYERVVAFAKANDLWIISDLAYSELYYDGKPTVSILQVPGAKDVAIEFTSLSKTYSMAGWRMGFAVGNKRLIAAMARVKSYLDYGAFTPIQAAAVAALNGPQDIVEKNRALYHKRRDVLVKSFTAAGWDHPQPRRLHVRLGSPAPGAGPPRLAGVLQTAPDPRQGRGRRRRRLRRERRGLCPHRPGRERTAHPSGRPQHQGLPQGPRRQRAVRG